MDGDNMSMPLYWSYQCTFVLKRLTTEEGDQWLFVAGLAACLIIALLSTASKNIKMGLIRAMRPGLVAKDSMDTDRQRIVNSESVNEDAVTKTNDIGLRLCLSFFYLYYSFMHVLVMLLIMTMNGYVVLSIVLGLTIGYAVFEEPIEAAMAREDELPVNCGACS